MRATGTVMKEKRENVCERVIKRSTVKEDKER